ncbi:MAG TPA: thiamine pyrophosphate-binding protein, partial [Thermomicrobiales bacterium]|nr:thiamine pyrophosphate-binding protein [Thermomicrobiales bacterium]
MADSASPTRMVPLADHLIERLTALGVRHVFGVPGDFSLALCAKFEASPIEFVNTCDEQGAGFAADAYARMTGFGAACVTYSVGGLKLANSTGQAFAEESPVLVISGAPGLAERARHPLLHHRVHDFDDQLRVFEQLTVASAALDDLEIAAREIDRVLAAIQREKRPGYLEIPRDLVDAEIEVHVRPPRPAPASDPDILAAAVAEAAARLRRAKRPVAVLGVELHRFGLTGAALRLVEKTGMPVAQTLLGKSAIDEDHPQYIGVYSGRMSQDATRRYVEASDAILFLGTRMTDLNLGGFTARFDPRAAIHATRDQVTIGYELYEKTLLGDFLTRLAETKLPRVAAPDAPYVPPLAALPEIDPATPITVDRLFARIASILTEQMVVIADPGDALFGAANLPIRRGVGFLAPAYYASLGFAVPASVGAGLADPAARPIVLVGDGSFQMTGVELSTAVRVGVHPIVIVL